MLRQKLFTPIKNTLSTFGSLPVAYSNKIIYATSVRQPGNPIHYTFKCSCGRAHCFDKKGTVFSPEYMPKSN